jgi:hypothetical protein
MNKLVPLLALTVLALAGCPFLNPPAQFTSADPLSGSRIGDLPPVFTGLDGAAEGDGMGGGSEVPRNVVEPDIIRRSGNLLYVLNQFRGLTLVDLDSETVLTQVPTYGFPRDLYFVGDHAYVLVAQAAKYATEGNVVSYSIGSRLYIVDVSVPTEAAIVTEFDLAGDLVDSRLVGDVLYAVGADFQWFWFEDGGGGGAVPPGLPDVTDGDGGIGIVKQRSDQSWVTSVNIADETNIHQADKISFSGAGTVIQASPTAIFVATPRWQSGETTITYVDISDPNGAMALRGAVNVPGNVSDQYKMDAWEQVLRIVSGGWTPLGLRAYVTTVSLEDPDTLEVLATIELDDAADETLFATRFDGPRGYVVTFLIVDPLFVLDLSDPADPQVLGMLEVPGWSTHIEPRGDRLITLGVDDVDGRRISVSIYDVSGVPERVDIVTFGENWAWSTGYSDVKAFTVLDDLIVVPFSGWNQEFGGYDRLQLISRDGDTLTLEGVVDLDGQGVRAFEYGDRLYGVTHEQLAVIDAADRSAPDVTSRIRLAEDVADLVEVGPGRFAEIIRKNSSGDTLVRAITRAGTKDGEVVLDVGYLAEVHPHGDGVVLVGTVNGGGYVYDGPFMPESRTSSYSVALVACPAGEAPSVIFRTTVEVTPYHGFFWWPLPYLDGRMGVGGAMPVADAAFWAPLWYPFTSDERSFVLGDTLALRCHAGAYDTVVGGAAPAEGLALVNLVSGEWESTLGLGVQDVVSLNEAGGTLIVGTKEARFSPTLPESAFYVQTLDVTLPSIGPRANVPGAFVQYDPVSEVLVLRDQQWSGFSDLNVSLRTVLWDGSASVTAVGQLPLPQFTFRVVGRGSRLYVEGYDDGYTLYPIAVGPAGGLTLGTPLQVTTEWGSLIDARGDDAYVALGGNAIVHYNFTGGAGNLVKIVPVMGYPSRVRFNASGAAAILGYNGWVEL